MNLFSHCSQEVFGELVGISQPAVSAHFKSGVLPPGQTAAQWVMSYTHYLREQAAARGADGTLAANRAAESRTRTELLEIRLFERRREFCPINIIDMVLTHVGRQICAALSPLPSTLMKRCPKLTVDDIKIIQTEVDTACNLALGISTASITELHDEDVDTLPIIPSHQPNP